jgi:hypothetical protein
MNSPGGILMKSIAGGTDWLCAISAQAPSANAVTRKTLMIEFS